jgi:hypothetical protein
MKIKKYKIKNNKKQAQQFIMCIVKLKVVTEEEQEQESEEPKESEETEESVKKIKKLVIEEENES